MRQYDVSILAVRGQKLTRTPHSFRVRPDRQAGQEPIGMALARISRDSGMQVLAVQDAGYDKHGRFYQATFGRPVKGTNGSVPMSEVHLKIDV